MQKKISNATRPLSPCCWRSVHDCGGNLGLSQILAMLLSHHVLLLKFLLYLCSVPYFSQLAIIYRLGLLTKLVSSVVIHGWGSVRNSNAVNIVKCFQMFNWDILQAKC